MATRSLLLIPVALAFVGVRTASAAEFATSQAMQALTNCEVRAIAQLDDGVSDPVSIASGIEPACASESENALNSFFKDHDLEPRTQLYLRQKMEADNIKIITNGILTYRASHRGRVDLQGSREVWQAVTAAADRKDYISELALLRPLANDGNAIAEAGIGMIYGLGEGVPEDDKEAAFWFNKAAMQHHSGSEGILGIMYEHGRGVQKNNVLALRWFILGAADGNATSIEGVARLSSSMPADQVAEAEAGAASVDSSHPTLPQEKSFDQWSKERK